MLSHGDLATDREKKVVKMQNLKMTPKAETEFCKME